MLKWDHRYELGHERIDAEHRIFLGLIVDFNDAASSGAPREKLARILKEIAKYAEFHFVSEENIMFEHNYPELAQHADLHNRLLAEVQDCYRQFIVGRIDANAVFDFLFNWFALHTSNEDKRLVGYLGN